MKKKSDKILGLLRIDSQVFQVIFYFFLFIFFDSKILSAAQKQSSLILVIVIDQFRSDYLTRFEKRFLPEKDQKGRIGGFSYLMHHSAYFPQGEYSLLQSITGPGHATILSGSFPYQSGIPNNLWYDALLQKEVYCTEDVSYPLVGGDPKLSHLGRSPKNFLGTTLGDELKNTGSSSQVISISIKDRAAILLGGHRADLALWYQAESKKWISSQYYLPSKKLPKWVEELNQKQMLNQGKTVSWKSTKKISPSSANSVFEHSYEVGAYSSLGTPYGVWLTEEVAEKAILSYKMGNRTSTDLLAISFSTHDMVGHTYGPNSQEIEEITAVEDQAISKLLNFLNKTIRGGLNEVFIVLTGDHGVAPNPEWAESHHLPSGKVYEQEVAEQINSFLNQKYGQPQVGQWVVNYQVFNFYLNQPEMERRKMDSSQIQLEAKSVILKNPFVAHVVTSAEYVQRKFPPGIFEKQTIHTYYPGRSGDLILIPKPGFISKPKNTGTSFSTHHTGYSYDRTVPILISGPRIKNGTYPIQAQVVDIAPTLSFLLGVLPPSLSEGRILSEMITSTKK